MTTEKTCPKLCGGDIELGNVLLGTDQPGDTTYAASAEVLRRIDGFPRSSSPAITTYGGNSACTGGGTSGAWYSGGNTWRSGAGDWGLSQWNDNSYPAYGANVDMYAGQGYGTNPQDYARRWLRNGGCIYGDMGHCEIALPICRSAFDAVAYFHAMLVIVRDALGRANADMADGTRIFMTTTNSDGHGQSWGGHLNFAVTDECYRNIFSRKLHHALFFGSHLCSSIIYTGSGKVQSENGRPPAPFELTQRGDFYETFTGPQTTANRPLINSRQEHLTSFDTGISRIHCIFFDSSVMHGSRLMSFACTQLVLACIEQGAVPADLYLDDPLTALTVWNQDPDLEARCKLISGSEYTAVEMQMAILEFVREFVDAGRADGLVPRAAEIVDLWTDTLVKLENKDFDALVPRVEWILKRHVLLRAMSQHAGLSWDSPEIKHLDHVFSSVDLDEGLYWQYERAGVLERVVSDGDIERCAHLPPEDTRAWLRGSLLGRADADAIDSIDWDNLKYRLEKQDPNAWPRYTYYTLNLGDPLGSTRAQCESLLDDDCSLEEQLVGLGARETDWTGRTIVQQTNNAVAS